MRWLRRLASGALLSLVACGSVDRNALDDPARADAGAVIGADRGTVANTDSGNPGTTVDAGVPVVPPVDAGEAPPPIDAGGPPPPIDAGGPPPPIDAGGPPPPVDAGMPMMDVPPVSMDTGPGPSLDPCASSVSCGPCAGRSGCGWCRNLGRCFIGSASGPLLRACASSDWSWTPGTCPATPPPDAGPPADSGCVACTASTAVAFCPGSGAGYCLAAQGCSGGGCRTCTPATAGGDTCTSAVVISSSGSHRTVLTTCGTSNNLDTGCNRDGNDIVFGVRVTRRARVVTRMTVPAGVSVNFGYDAPAGACRGERRDRPCNNTATSSTQGFDTTLDPGTYYLYVVTSQPTTIVVDTDLP